MVHLQPLGATLQLLHLKLVFPSAGGRMRI